MNRVIGHDAHYQSLAKAIASGRLHHGWILTGPRGVGKASFANEAARMLVDPDNRYASMVDHRTHPDIIWVQRLPKDAPKDGEPADPDAELKRSITIDQIRMVQHSLTTRPSMGPKRVVIIDAADDLERGGANALLKSLEEPPVGTYFMLVSHASDRLLPTIRSRCQVMRFDPLNDADMRQTLQQLVPQAAMTEIEALVRSGRGLPGQAITLAGMEFATIENMADEIVQSGDPSNKLRHKLAEALSLKNAQASYEAFLRFVPVKIAALGRSGDLANAIDAVDAFHEADRLAARAIGLTLDKQAVLLQMGNLLAGLHKRG